MQIKRNKQPMIQQDDMNAFYKFPKKRKIPWRILILPLVLVAGWLIPAKSLAQIGIKSSDVAVDGSAILEVASTTKGWLIPRMTVEQRNAISSPVEGLMIFNTDTETIELFNGDVWTSTTGQFLCGITQVKDSQGNTYQTVLIGSQCWMAENLNIGTRIDVSTAQSDNGIIEKYCYNNLEANCNEYGGLYQWNEMMQYSTTQGIQGICPDGWHLPVPAEYNTLITFLGGESVAGGKLKETGFDHWEETNTGATNSSGFTARGGGWSSSASFFDLKGSCNLWTSEKEFSSGLAYYYYMYAETIAITQGGENTSFGFSVRCLKDD